MPRLTERSSLDTVGLAGSPSVAGLNGGVRGGSDSSIARFWAKVAKTPTCWLWTASVSGGGGMKHGQASWPGRSPQKAHRLAWELTRGPIPAGQQVNHHCDRPLCCNPDHLYLGSQRDNMRDASERGRLTVSRRRKLTLAQRLAIYHMPDAPGLSTRLATAYGVSKTCVYMTRQGRFLGSGAWHGTVQSFAQAHANGNEIGDRAFHGREALLSADVV